MDYKLNRAWAEINLDNISNNIKEIRRIISPDAKIMGVVKADAYGHGVKEVANTLISEKADCLAVSILDEAIQLRQSGVHIPVLVLGYSDPARTDEIVDFDITQTVFDLDLAKALSLSATKKNKKIRIHIKIDTGMSRVGFLSGYSAIKNILAINEMPNLIIEGLFSHFATSDENDGAFTREQYERFMSIYSELTRVGLHIPVKHLANSGAVLAHKYTHLDMVRPGLILYGMYPSKFVKREDISLKPAMSIKANIIMIKTIPAGYTVSYGRTFTAERDTVTATLPIGYADGFTRALSNRGHVLIHGQMAKIIGVICMDQCMADITDIKGDISVGDEAVIYGKQGKNEILIEDVAEDARMINYELSCIVGRRMPRAYISNGKMSKIISYII